MADEMILYEGYVKAFVRGRLTLDKLLAEFAGAIAADESYRPKLKALVESYLNSGDLPTAAYRRLRKELQLGDGSVTVTQMATVSHPSASTSMALDDETDMIPLDAFESFTSDSTDSPVESSDTAAARQGAHDSAGAPDEETVVAKTGSVAGVVTQAVPGGGTGGSSWDRSGTSAPPKSSTWSDPESWSGQGDDVLSVGSVIKERFELIENIGKGGMGEVFKAIDRRKVEAQDRDPYVAVKVLNEEFKKHPQALQALQREARKTQELAHPNIMTVYDFDRQGGNVYMTMEFLDGEPIDAILKKRKADPFPEEEAMKIIAGMCEALAYAHRRGLVHSDFKPGNVFLRRDGTVKVLDFGIAARVSRPLGDGEEDGADKTLFDVKQFGAFTPAYASCEIMEGQEPDPRDDIYALACVAYQLLGGKHPFNRKKATFARDNGMKPEPIPTLNRAQWRALQKGLAFAQADRAATVEELFDGLQRKKSRIVPISVGVAALVLLIGLGLRGPLLDYLQGRDEARLISRLESGDPVRVEEALRELASIEDAALLAAVLGNAREAILRYYSLAIEEKIDESKARYEFPRAEELVVEARRLYPDSAQLEGVNDQMATRKSRLLNDLTTRFNTDIEGGKLLPDDKEGVAGVLEIVAQINPGHPLLTDPRLAPAYAREADKALAAEDLDRAETLVVAGLNRFQDNATLINLRDEIGAQRARQNEAAEIAEIETRLRQAGIPEDLTQFAALRTDLLRLQELLPAHELLGDYKTQAEKLLEPALTSAIAARTWDEGLALLSNYTDLLPRDFVAQGQQRLADARATLGTEVDALFAQFEAAVKDNRLAPPAQPNASDLLNQVAATAGDDPRVAQARSRLGQSYLALARAARANSDWAQAKQHIDAGLSHQPSQLISASLEAERVEIAKAEQAGTQALASAEQAAQAQKREAQLKGLYQQFDTDLAKLYAGVAPSVLVQVLDQVAALSPTDPLVTNGRDRLAQKVADHASGLAGQGKWDDAFAVAREGLQVVPDSALLSGKLKELERTRQTELAKSQGQAVRNLRVAIESKLADPKFDKKWERALGDDLKNIADLVAADDSWRNAIRQQIATLYIGKATASTQKQRFVEARAYLKSGERLSQQNALFAEELAKLESAQIAFDRETQAQAGKAEVEARKQTLLTQAEANDVQAAVATLEKLKQDLPKDDSFLKTTAPQAIGGAYMKLARGLAEREQYTDALKLVTAGLKTAPGIAALEQAAALYRDEARVQELRDELTRADTPKAASVEALKKSLANIRVRDRKRATDLQQEFVALFKNRRGTLGATDSSAADSWNTAGAAAFPGDTGFPAETSPSVATLEPKKLEPTKPPVAAPTAAVRGSGVSPQPCASKIAGYGADRRGTCFDLVTDKVRGPLMVVVPGGTPFAITKYEVTVRDYNAYCVISKECGKLGADGALPVTGVAYQSAEKYANWLTQRTGVQYRLPSEQEWEYAATASGGNDKGKYNCLLKQGGNVLRGGKLLPVNTGAANGWGLVHSVGNAQEWVSGGQTARGGAYVDPMSNCAVSLKHQHSGSGDEYTGFRLVREVRG